MKNVRKKDERERVLEKFKTCLSREECVPHPRQSPPAGNGRVPINYDRKRQPFTLTVYSHHIRASFFIVYARKWSLMLTITYHSIHWRNQDFRHRIPQPQDTFSIAVNSNMHCPLKHDTFMSIFPPSCPVHVYIIYVLAQ